MTQVPRVPIRESAKRPVGLVVRAATDADLSAVLKIYAPHVLEGTASFEDDLPTTAEMAARRHAVIGHGCPYLVAERSGLILGFANAGPFRSRSAFRSTVESSVYVDQTARRAGVAHALMTALIDGCANAGFRQMIAVIGGDNPASVALHEALGFRHAGIVERVGFKFGRWLDITILQRDLPAPGTAQPPPSCDQK